MFEIESKCYMGRIAKGLKVRIKKRFGEVIGYMAIVWLESQLASGSFAPRKCTPMLQGARTYNEFFDLRRPPVCVRLPMTRLCVF